MAVNKLVLDGLWLFRQYEEIIRKRDYFFVQSDKACCIYWNVHQRSVENNVTFKTVSKLPFVKKSELCMPEIAEISTVFFPKFNFVPYLTLSSGMTVGLKMF